MGGKVELKGDLSEIQDEINNTIDQYQLLANSSALSELQTENSKSIISARKNQSELLSELNSKQTQIENKLKQSGKTYSWLINQYERYKNNSLKADDRIDAKNNIETVLGNGGYEEINSLMKLKNSYNECTAGLNKLIMTQDDMSDVQKVLKGDYSDAVAVLMTYKAGMISLEDVQNSQWKTLNKLEEAAKDSGKNTVMGLVEGTQEYQEALVKKQ